MFDGFSTWVIINNRIIIRTSMPVNECFKHHGKNVGLLGTGGRTNRQTAGGWTGCVASRMRMKFADGIDNDNGKIRRCGAAK